MPATPQAELDWNVDSIVKPFALAASYNTGTGETTLSWTAPDSSLIDHFDVYTSNTPNSFPGQPRQPNPPASTTFVDVPDQLPAFYRVIGRMKNGLNIPYNDTQVCSPNDQAPAGTITAPASGAVVAGTVLISVACNDDTALSSVVIQYQDRGKTILVPIAVSGLSATANYSLDTLARPMTNGTHYINARIFDRCGNNALAINPPVTGVPYIAIDVENPITDPGPLIFAKTAGNSTLSARCDIVDAKFDSAGNIIVVGNIFGSGTIDFAGTTITPTPGGSGNDIFVAKFSPSGTLNWVFKYGGSFDETVKSVAIDSADNIIIAGDHVGTFNLGGANITSSGGTVNPDIFLAKFNNSGAHQWSKGFGGSSGNSAYRVAVDSANNAYVVGLFNGNADFGGGTRTAGDQGDSYIVKYLGANGNYVWDRVVTGPQFHVMESVLADSSGHIYACGFTDGNVDMGGGSLTFLGGSSNGMVAKYNASDGSHVWSRIIAGGGIGSTDCLTLDGSGSLYIGGTFDTTFLLDAITFAAGQFGPNGPGSYVAKLDPSTGTAVAGFSLGGNSGVSNSSCGIKSLAVDSNGMIVFAGVASGEVDFGDGTTTTGTGTIFIAKYTPTMLIQTTGTNSFWYHRYTPSPNSFALARSVAINSNREIVMVGRYSGSITVGSNALSSASFSTYNGFLIKYSP